MKWLAALALLGITTGASEGAAPVERRPRATEHCEVSMFWTPSAEHRIVIRRVAAPAIELTVLRGMYVALCGIDTEAKISRPRGDEPMPRVTTATGNLVLRMQPEREVHFIGTKPMDEIMASAPVGLVLQGVELTISTVVK